MKNLYLKILGKIIALQISVKNIIVEENDNDDESDSSLLKRKINQSTIKINNRKRTNTNLHFSAQKTLIPYSTLNLKNNN